MQSHQFSRRAFLRGVGVTMALPWMESLRVWGDEAKSSTAASEAPIRLCVTFSGNGFHSREWWAKGSGRDMELGQVLAPLADFREKLLFVRGLYHEEARKGNIHSSQTGNMLSGAPIASGGQIRSGTSFDQVVARTYGHSTKVPSLVLACETSNPSVHKNYSMLYSSHISWSSPTTPTPLELYPALAFDRLFKDEASPEDKSVLDAVLADAHELRRKISTGDQQKLDEYLDSVREIETRVANAGKRGELQGWRPTLDKPDIPRPADGVPQDIAEHMRLMIDILVLGFQTDTTRVATLKLNNDHSALRFPNLASVEQVGHGIDYMIHHLLSHSDGADATGRDDGQPARAGAPRRDPVGPPDAGAGPAGRREFGSLAGPGAAARAKAHVSASDRPPVSTVRSRTPCNPNCKLKRRRSWQTAHRTGKAGKQLDRELAVGVTSTK